MALHTELPIHRTVFANGINPFKPPVIRPPKAPKATGELICEYIRDHGPTATVVDIAKALSSTRDKIRKTMIKLEKKGYVKHKVTWGTRKEYTLLKMPTEPLNRTKAMLAFISEHTGCTAAQMEAALPFPNVSSLLSLQVKRGRVAMLPGPGRYNVYRITE